MVAHVLLNEGGQPGFQFIGIAALAKQDVAVRLAPVPHVGRFVRIVLLDPKRREYVESEVRVGGQVPHDAGHLEMEGPLGIQDLPHGVLVAEVLPGNGLRQHDFVDAGQGGPGIAHQKRHVEHVEDRRVGQVEVPFVESPIPVLDHPGVAGRVEPDHFFHFGEVFAHEFGRGHHDFGRPDHLVAIALFRDHAVDTVRLPMITVVAEFIADVQQDEEGARDPERQAHHVDERVSLPAVQMAHGHRQVVTEHGTLDSDRRINGETRSAAACVGMDRGLRRNGPRPTRSAGTRPDWRWPPARPGNPR